jgi:adenine deaminase
MTARRWARERAALAAVARGASPADRYVRGGRLLNVYTGEIYPANVAVAGERIAYVGLRDDMIGPRTQIVEARERILVPGYIEPHAHPWNLVSPAALARHVLPLGTTSIVADNLPVYLLAGARGFERTVRALASSPLKFYWMLRVHAQSRSPDEARRFPLSTLRRLIADPWVAAVGEVTRWPDVLGGRLALLERLGLAAERGKRIEGHTAGANPERLVGLASAGLTSDHEPITAEEALVRARQGIALMLRQSSLRPDLHALLEPFVKSGSLGRLMLTTDGSTPAFITEHGFVDGLVRLAMAEGVPPVDAYRMVTLNPATYYGKDADLGGVAPGRYADILLLHDLAEPRPQTVIARGRVAARDGRLVVPVREPPWSRIFTARATRFDRGWRLAPEALALPSGPLPVIRLVSAVITSLEERPMGPGDLLAALIDRRGQWITTTALAGFATTLDGLATTTSTDYEILALGRDPRSMAAAVNRLLALRGGIVVVEGRRVLEELPLPVGGIVSTRPLGEVASAERRLQACLASRGHPFHAPIYTLLFLTADFLPSVRLTERGVWDVRRGRVLRPSRRLPRGR